MKSSDKLKVGKRVEARTVRGDGTYFRGTIADVSTGKSGSWYTIKSKAYGGEFKTRAACIK